MPIPLFQSNSLGVFLDFPVWMFINTFSGNENFSSYFPQCIYLFVKSPNPTSCLFCPPPPHPTPTLCPVSHHPVPGLHPWSQGVLSLSMLGFLNSLISLCLQLLD